MHISKTEPDSSTITIEQNVRFQRGLYPVMFQQNYILMADLWSFLAQLLI